MNRIEWHEDKSITVHCTNAERSRAWVVRLAPGDTEQAEQLLSPEQLTQVTDVWTQEVIDAWRAANPDYAPPVLPGPELPSDKARIAALEDAVLELALGGLI